MAWTENPEDEEAVTINSRLREGVAALQEGGALPARVLDLPGLPLLGVYPTLQGLVLQALVAATVVGGLAWSGHAARAGVTSR